MSDPRRVPELALAVGVALAAPVVLFVALFDSLVTAALAGAALLYPFAGYAVLADDDPTAVLVPEYVLSATVAAGTLTALVGLATGAGLLGAVAGLVVALPGSAYQLRYGAPLLPVGPAVTLGLALAGSAGLLGAGVLAGDPALGAVGAVLAGLGGADRYRVRGGPLSTGAERAVVAACLAGVVLAVVGSVLAGAAAAGVVLSVGLLAVAGVLAL
jgi:hypothetical protein